MIIIIVLSQEPWSTNSCSILVQKTCKFCTRFRTSVNIQTWVAGSMTDSLLSKRRWWSKATSTRNIIGMYCLIIGQRFHLHTRPTLSHINLDPILWNSRRTACPIFYPHHSTSHRHAPILLRWQSMEFRSLLKTWVAPNLATQLDEHGMGKGPRDPRVKEWEKLTTTVSFFH